MSNFFKQNISLILAVALPIVLIAGISLSIIIPKSQIKPSYDFVYQMIEYDYNEMKSANPDGPMEPTRQISYYYHDIKKNESRPITEEEMNNLNLVKKQESKDGFRVSCGSRTEGFFLFIFTSEDCEEHYLKGNGYAQKLNLANPANPDYYNPVELLGWVENNS